MLDCSEDGVCCNTEGTEAQVSLNGRSLPHPVLGVLGRCEVPRVKGPSLLVLSLQDSHLACVLTRHLHSLGASSEDSTMTKRARTDDAHTAAAPGAQIKLICKDDKSVMVPVEALLRCGCEDSAVVLREVVSKALEEHKAKGGEGDAELSLKDDDADGWTVLAKMLTSSDTHILASVSAATERGPQLWLPRF